MDMKTETQLNVNDIPFQDASVDIWDKKYRLKNPDGTNVDETMGDTRKRVALALSNVEDESKRKVWHDKFLWALENGAIPAGRITSNAGAENQKSAVSTINCTVSRIIRDSMSGIADGVHDAFMTLRAGCGIGYEFSTLRPKGAFVQGAGATTSGPLSFMDVFDSACFTISSAGGRRGAQMATFDISHPDVMEFIRAKREDGRLRQFNLSLLITDEFIEAVKNEEDWKLVFPAFQSEVDDGAEIVWRHWTSNEKHHVVNDKGETACKVYKTVKAVNLWDMIMSSTYDFAEPGFILIDKVNDMNNNWFCEDIRATNP